MKQTTGERKIPTRLFCCDNFRELAFGVCNVAEFRNQFHGGIQMIAKTQTEAVKINIQDVGAIKDVTIPIQRGTIVKLIGENGSGKSTAIKAITSAVTKQNVGLTPRDGRMSGKVRMPGATVTFGARLSKKATGEETVSFAIVEDGTGISKILNPGLKDEVAADKKRLEGVLDVIGATLTEEQMREYLGDLYAEFTKSRDVKGKGFVDAVKEMKLFLESKAREVNVSLTQCDGAIAEIGVIEAETQVEESPEQIGKRVEALALEVRDAKRDRAKADEVAAIVDVGDDAKLEEYKSELTLAKNRETESSEELIRIDDQIAKLQKLRSEVKESLVKAQTDTLRLSDLIVAESGRRQQIAKLKEQVASALSAEEIAAKETELDALRTKHVEAIRVSSEQQKIAQKRARLKELQTQREQFEKSHAKFKAKAIGTQDLMKDALKSASGWTVNEDLRLCVEHSRGVIPFSELSPGEGTAKVCLLACQFAECGEDEIPVIGLPQELFEGLDGHNVRLLLDAVAENNLCVVTAECDKSENPQGLRVEVMAD